MKKKVGLASTILRLGDVLVSKHFTIYTLDNCPYCDKAKELIKSKGWAYTAHRIEDDNVFAVQLKQMGIRTYPQIWVHPTLKRIGGYDDLQEWIKNNES